MRRLRRLLPSGLRWRTEVVMPIPGDPRSIDAVLSDPSIATAFELETRLLDCEGLVRRANRKVRDAGLRRMVLVFADTKANRDAVAAAEPTLRAAYPLGPREVLAALRAGRAPAANGIVFV